MNLLTYLPLLLLWGLTIAPAQTTNPNLETIELYLVAMGDDGNLGERIGCNDSLVAMPRLIRATDAPLTVAIKELLRTPERVGHDLELYNVMYQPDLSLESAEVTDGEAILHFTGTLVTGGVCDTPRVQAQLEATALQFATVERVSVYIDGISLEDYLSERGDDNDNNNDSVVSEVQIFLIATDDGGTQGELIGCNDSVVGISRSIEPTIAPLTAAYEELFRLSRHADAPYADYYNVFSGSDLRVSSAEVEDGTAWVYLTGDLEFVGGACDLPRVEAQLESIARQFATVEEVNIFLNDTPLDEVLSVR